MVLKLHRTAEKHEADWESLCIVDSLSWKTERKVREALHIRKREPSMNRVLGIERSTTKDVVL